MMNNIKSLLEVIKFPLCFHITLSAVFGFIIASKSVSFSAIGLGAFVMFLAWGCAALNNIQDMEFDACHARTRNRVLVSRQLEKKTALITAILCMGVGLMGLWFCYETPIPFICGVTALFCYNVLYTPLKKKTLMAIVPGTISGMLPPLIGWTAAGQSVIDYQILIIMSVMGLWQIPHYFLVLLKNENDLEPEKYPSFKKIFSLTELKLQVLIWCGLYSLSMFFYLVSGTFNSFYLSILVALNALAIIFWIGFKFMDSNKTNYKNLFVGINTSIIIFMAAGIFQYLNL